MPAPTSETTCPICAVVITATPRPENCPQCNAMLQSFDATPAMTKPAPASSAGAGSEWLEAAPRVAMITLGATTISAVLFAGAVFLLSPIFESNARVWLLAAAYFGGLIGFLTGFLWSVLGLVDRKFLWGLTLGGAAGSVAGIVNFFVLRVGGLLPEVEPLENFVVGLLAGLIAGLGIAVFRDRA